MRKVLLLLVGLVLLMPLLTGCIRIRQSDEIQEAKWIKLYGDLRERMGRLEEKVARLEEAVESGAVVVRKGENKSSAASLFKKPKVKYGGVLRIVQPTDPPTLDPAHVTDSTSSFVCMQIYEGLVELGPDLKVRPAIAERWEIKENGTTYVFHLRRGVKFHTGREVTAKDFLYSYLRILDPKTKSERTWLFENVLGYDVFKAYRKLYIALKDWINTSKETAPAGVKEALAEFSKISDDELKRIGDDVFNFTKEVLPEVVKAVNQNDFGKAKVCFEKIDSWFDLKKIMAKGFEVPDDYTFIIRLKQPFAPFLAVLTMVNAAVVDKDTIEKYGEDWSNEHPVGTGPFKLKEWKHDVRIVLEANKDYWRGRPYVDEVLIRIIKDEVTSFTEFEVGNVDIHPGVPDSKYKYVKKHPVLSKCYQEKPSLSVFYIGFNCKKYPLNIKKLRQALAYAVDKEKIVEKVREGRAVVARGIIPPGLPGANPDVQNYPYNPDLAKKLLAEAGFPGGVGLPVIDLWYNTSERNARIAEVVQYYFKKIGVKVRLNNVDWGTYLKKLDSGECQMFRLGWIADYPDAENFLYILFHSKNAGANGNHTFYSNSEVDKILDEARREVDFNKRVKLYQKAEKMIMDDAPWIPMFHNKDIILYQPYVKGVELTPMGADHIRLRSVWLDK